MFEASSARNSSEPYALKRAERLSSALGMMIFVALARGGNYVYVLDFLCFEDGLAKVFLRSDVIRHQQKERPRRVAEFINGELQESLFVVAAVGRIGHKYVEFGHCVLAQVLVEITFLVLYIHLLRKLLVVRLKTLAEQRPDVRRKTQSVSEQLGGVGKVAVEPTYAARPVQKNGS